MYVHEKRVVHCDVKPANLLVSMGSCPDEVQVKLIDFGIASWYRRDQKEFKVPGGTPGYTCPEYYSKHSSMVQNATYGSWDVSVGN